MLGLIRAEASITAAEGLLLAVRSARSTSGAVSARPARLGGLGRPKGQATAPRRGSRAETAGEVADDYPAKEEPGEPEAGCSTMISPRCDSAARPATTVGYWAEPGATDVAFSKGGSTQAM
jgi:hypothetical protein